MVYSHIDRIITAGFMPVDQVLKLEAVISPGWSIHSGVGTRNLR